MKLPGSLTVSIRCFPTYVKAMVISSLISQDKTGFRLVQTSLNYFFDWFPTVSNINVEVCSCPALSQYQYGIF